MVYEPSDVMGTVKMGTLALNGKRTATGRIGTLCRESEDHSFGRAEPTNMEDAGKRVRVHASLLLVGAVVASGAAVMIYEFIAVRVLQRYFGGRLDVWASEIAVVMAGLALGYYWGGRLADRFRSTRLLGLSVVMAGLLGASILPAAEWAGERLLEVDVGLAWHPLLAAGFSSFLPFLMLGAVLPQVIRLRVADLASVGRVAGTVAALSTLGSIAGVLATGMYLLAHFGVRETLYATSVVLAALGAAIALLPRKATMALLAIACLVPAVARAEIVFEGYSAYHHILVEDVGEMRVLLFDNDQESRMSLRDPYTGGFEYSDFFHVPKVLHPTIDRVLFVGLGGGTGPKSFLRHYPDVTVDVVDIDPAVVAVAREYFALPDHPRIHVAVADGRAYLQRRRERYGAILVDAYTRGPYGAILPYHLATQEFFEIVRHRLVNGGCLVYNVPLMAEGDASVLADLHRTIVDAFQRAWVFQARTSLNFVIVAQKIDADVQQPDTKRWPDGPWADAPPSSAQLGEIAAALLGTGHPLPPTLPQRLGQAVDLPAGRILTDDYAPTDASPGRP